MIRVSGDGNICQDMTLRYVQSGRAVINLRLSVFSKKVNDGPNERFFIDLTLWGELAENAAESFGKGDSVLFTGVLQEESFTKRDGEERKSLKIIGDMVGPSLRYATAKTTVAQNSTFQSDDVKREAVSRQDEMVQDARASTDEEPF
jgi:single-strand DNA-binding protein